MMHNEEQSRTDQWYIDYYKKKGKNRNDVLSNSEVLFQHLAFEDSIISTLRKAKIEKESAKILDIGCGSGGSLARFVQLGFQPNNLYGIDIIADRIQDAKEKYPNINFVCDDASSMSHASGIFDLVLESTMFVQLTNDELAKNIANEMLRVTKTGGYILLIDWRYSKPGDSAYLGVPTKRIKYLFSVGSSSKIIYQKNGAIIPPVGRKISKYMPSVYFIVKSLLPFLCGQQATLLQKI